MTYQGHTDICIICEMLHPLWLSNDYNPGISTIYKWHTTLYVRQQLISLLMFFKIHFTEHGV